MTSIMIPVDSQPLGPREFVHNYNRPGANRPINQGVEAVQKILGQHADRLLAGEVSWMTREEIFIGVRNAYLHSLRFSDGRRIIVAEYFNNLDPKRQHNPIIYSFDGNETTTVSTLKGTVLKTVVGDQVTVSDVARQDNQGDSLGVQFFTLPSEN